MARLLGSKISGNGIVFASGVRQGGQPSVSLAHLVFIFLSQKPLTGNKHTCIAAVNSFRPLFLEPTHVHTVFQNAGLPGEV
jgi:hypothetical protein